MAQILRVQAPGEPGGLDPIAEHHREPTALGFRARLGAGRLRGCWSGLRRGLRRRFDEPRRRFQKAPPVTHREPQVAEILRSQLRQQVEVHVVVGQCVRVATEPLLLEPLRDVAHGDPPVCGRGSERRPANITERLGHLRRPKAA